MSYLNNQTGYRNDLLMTRSVVRKGNFVLLEPDGLVKNSIPGYSLCDVTILGSPAMGASFADYFVTAHAGGANDGIGGDGIESFIYVIKGSVTVRNSDVEAVLKGGGYIYSPPFDPVSFINESCDDAYLYIYRRRYEPLSGGAVHTVVGDTNQMEWLPYEDMDNCRVKNLLPAGEDMGYDMNMHMLMFTPGASHGYIETHVQEHGMYFLSGEAMYRLDDEWIPVKKGDYVFMDSYCPQACYGVGRDEPLVYIYSKDCNRDVAL